MAAATQPTPWVEDSSADSCRFGQTRAYAVNPPQRPSQGLQAEVPLANNDAPHGNTLKGRVGKPLASRQGTPLGPAAVPSQREREKMVPILRSPLDCLPTDPGPPYIILRLVLTACSPFLSANQNSRLKPWCPSSASKLEGVATQGAAWSSFHLPVSRCRNVTIYFLL